MRDKIELCHPRVEPELFEISNALFVHSGVYESDDNGERLGADGALDPDVEDVVLELLEFRDSLGDNSPEFFPTDPEANLKMRGIAIASIQRIRERKRADLPNVAAHEDAVDVKAS